MGDSRCFVWVPVQFFTDIRVGDAVRHRGGKGMAVVAWHGGQRATAVRVLDMTQADEWEVLRHHDATQEAESDA